ncbi:MAG: hypothetical protein ACJ8AG_07645 [Ktedonobacteraceae bacterium]
MTHMEVHQWLTFLIIERLATSGVSRPFDLIVLVRVWLGAGFTSPGLLVNKE